MLLSMILFLACSEHNPDKPAQPQGEGAGEQPGQPAGEAREPSLIRIDGSSTVFPITEAVAEEFEKTGKARATIGVSGTGGGFEKLCRGEIDIAGASREIKDSEKQACAAGSVAYVEIPVAYDGLAVVVNPQNDWASAMTVAELKALWEPEAQGKVTRWSQVRAGWPDEEIHLFGAGVDSGTYDYFTQAIVGKEHSSRGDFTSSEDDNVLVQGVSGDRLALGFFGLAYLKENAGKLKALGIDDGKPENGADPVMPSVETVTNGTYVPLSRPLFIYVSRAALQRAEIRDFVEFYLKSGDTIIPEVGYVPLPAAERKTLQQLEGQP